VSARLGTLAAQRGFGRQAFWLRSAELREALRAGGIIFDPSAEHHTAVAIYHNDVVMVSRWVDSAIPALSSLL
jgi:hypothetical protein